MLEALLPEARIGVGHGQMNERDLEKSCATSWRNITFCCVPRLSKPVSTYRVQNTIIMHRTDKFGLAQLHQLRGRVGRSHHQAYAYLLGT